MKIPVPSQLKEGSTEDNDDELVGTRKEVFSAQAARSQCCPSTITRAPCENDSPLLLSDNAAAADDDDDDENEVPGADEIICRLCPRWPPFVAVRCLLVSIAALWGSKIAIIKYLQGESYEEDSPNVTPSPSEISFAGFGVGALVSLPFLLGQDIRVILGGAECGVWAMVGYISQAVALGEIKAGKVAFICSLNVITVPIMEYASTKREMKYFEILAGVLAVVGVAFMENVFVVGFEGFNRGTLVAFLQPIGFGYSYIRIQYYQKKYKDVPNRARTIAMAQGVVYGIISVIWVLVDEKGALPSFEPWKDPVFVFLTIWTGIVAGIFSVYMVGVALKEATPTDAAIILTSEPLWAGLLAFFIMGEQLSTHSLIGGFIIVLACVIGSLPSPDICGKKSTDAVEDEEGPDYIAYTKDDESSLVL